MKPREVGQRWSKYTGKLLDGEKPETDDAANVRIGLEILEREIRWVMKDIKKGKSAGSDVVMIETLQAVGDMVVKYH